MERAEIDAVLEAMPRKRHKKILVKGVGKNDSDFCTGMEVNGKIINHQAYDIWSGMLQRCYDKKFHEIHPHYEGCSVSDEWLTFSNFFLWWKENSVDGWDLDKDLLFSGNRVYSSETCLFIPKYINCFLTAKSPNRRDLPMGVYRVSKRKIYKSLIGFNGGRIYLGCFSCAIEANRAWLKAKLEIAYSYKEECDLIGVGIFEKLIERVMEFSAKPLDHREAQQIRVELDTSEHIKSLRAMRAA